MRVRNPASHLLAGMAKVVPVDWQRVYNHRIYFFETFVDTTRFKGSCYKEPKSETQKKKNSQKRKPGGQPGHKGTHRELIPIEDVNQVMVYYPDKCEGCTQPLPQDESANVIGDPFRWQVTEIEPIKAKVTEHQAHTTLCECGCQTSAKLPAEIVKSNFGPRFAAIIAYLTAVLHASRRGTCEFCITFLGIQIAFGSIQNLLEDTSGALASIDEELKEALPEEPVLNADETGWLDRWLWVFVALAPTFIYFQVAKSRGHQVLVGLLGTVYNGILLVDRWGAYTKYHKGIFQLCRAHLKRDFLGILKIGQSIQSADAIFFANTMEKLRKQLMAIWYQFKAAIIPLSMNLAR